MTNLLQVLADLRKRRAEIGETMARLDAAIKKVEEAIAVVGVDNLPGLDFELPQPQASPSRIRGETPPAIVVSVAREVLLEAGKPMKRGELVRAIEAKGIALTGKDKNKNLGTILWRHPELFVNLDELGYWPKDVPLEGVYAPLG
jgi:hypothetical protein